VNDAVKCLALLESPWWALSLVGFSCSALSLLCAAWLRRARRRFRLRARFDGARALEDEAPALLARHGYEVIDSQAQRRCTLEVAGEVLDFVVKADYLVRDRELRLYVAEVKSGPKASQPVNRATRRQLLEYQFVYHDTEGVLLVDMDRRLVRRVRFSRP
jgi:hypothetical protein